MSVIDDGNVELAHCVRCYLLEKSKYQDRFRRKRQWANGEKSGDDLTHWKELYMINIRGALDISNEMLLKVAN